ncbi:hypothetical protein V1511DRAFT_461427, partial [Dipodascopsis uninucleata]
MAANADITWTRQSVSHEEALEFIKLVTAQIKHRGVLEPFVLLPCRPRFNLIDTKLFVHRVFGESVSSRTISTETEILLADVEVLMSSLKWVWARLPGGVVSWEAYELYKAGEEDTGMDKTAFSTLIPLITESQEKSAIIFLFFDLLSAIAAHWKTSGMSGRKIARMAAIWAFPISDRFDSSQTPSFTETYKAWLKAADASTHMFLAYLRSQQADMPGAESGVTSLGLPLSLANFLTSMPYPPTRTAASNAISTAVVTLSSVHDDSEFQTPSSMLSVFYGAAKSRSSFGLSSTSNLVSFLYAEGKTVDSFLLPECSRIINELSSLLDVKVSLKNDEKRSASHSKPSESRFAYSSSSSSSGLTAESRAISSGSISSRLRDTSNSTISSSMTSVNATDSSLSKSWNTFLVSGFNTQETSLDSIADVELSLPTVDTLLNKRAGGHMASDGILSDSIDSSLDISNIPVDDSFYWTWICGMAPEEPIARRSIFSTCTVIEADLTPEFLAPRMDIPEQPVVVFTYKLDKPNPLPVSNPQLGRTSSALVKKQSTFRIPSRKLRNRGLPPIASKTQVRESPSLLSLYKEYKTDASMSTISVLQERTQEPKSRKKNTKQPSAQESEALGRLAERAEIIHKAAMQTRLRDASNKENRKQSVLPTIESESLDGKRQISVVLELDEDIGKALEWA